MLKRFALLFLLFLTGTVPGGNIENRLLSRPGHTPDIHTAGQAE